MTRLQGPQTSLARFLPRWSELDTSLPTWRARAVRYVLIYLALVLVLVTVRALTSDVRPALRAAEKREAALITQNANLTVQLQTLENQRRLKDWAQARGMRLVAVAPKATATFTPLPPAPGRPAAARTLEVKTLWK
ncbi:hypothetical protein [Deinococcus arcticus]|uniref:Cell division protein FtsL n=1 Tax=Deinococcus arcticus TaxID=2136176 RepID=A0A2T3W518_9DEIO|nr:hypothetical protein [Deinococcus arcticus]PTA66990.1 hypothetical protein C8263_14840 [Deinococcus arcticus]